MDAKKVVDNFLSTKHDVTEFRNIIQNCQSLFRNYYENSKVKFYGDKEMRQLTL